MFHKRFTFFWREQETRDQKKSFIVSSIDR